jgi:hypothetical protein
LLVDFGSFHSRFDVINDTFNYTVTRHRWNYQELKYRILSSALIHVLAHFQRTMCSQIYFRFSSYLLRKTAFICNIDCDWMIYRKHPIRSLLTSMLRKTSIRYLSDVHKNVLLCTRLYKYAPNLESLLTQQYVCIMCTLWSDNTCVFTRFHCVKNANTQLIWSSATCQILNTAIMGTWKIGGRKQTFRCHSYLYSFQGKNE